MTKANAALRTSPWTSPRSLVWAFALLVILLAYTTTLMIALSNVIDPQQYFRFFGSRDAQGDRWLATLIHIVPGMIALLSGPVQFLHRIRHWAPVLHRLTGWLYITAVATSLIGASRIITHSHGGPSTATGLGTLGVIWGIATLVGLIFILRRDPASHRRWMVRSYAATAAAVSLRFQLQFLIGLIGLDFDRAYVFVAWTSWLPILLLAEIWLRRPLTGGHGVPV